MLLDANVILRFLLGDDDDVLSFDKKLNRLIKE